MAGAVVVGVGSNTAMGSTCVSILKAEDVSNIYNTLEKAREAFLFFAQFIYSIIPKQF